MASAANGNEDRLAPGTVLGRDELGRQLGRGGMGAVYEAVQRDLRKPATSPPRRRRSSRPSAARRTAPGLE